MNGSPKSSMGLNAWKCGKLKNVDSRATHGRPMLLTTTKGGQSSWQTTREWRLGSNMSSTKHVGDLGMNSYAHWITFSGVRLFHIHKNRWVQEPIGITSTCTSSPIQVIICCHLTKTANGGTFSNKYARGCICDYYKCCTIWINPQNKLDLGSKSPWPVPTCERLGHNHL